MSRLCDGGDRFDAGVQTSFGLIMTLSVWFYTSSTATMCLGINGEAGTGNNYLKLLLSGEAVAVQTRNATTTRTATASGTYTANTWTHACGLWGENSNVLNRSAFRDGANKGSDVGFLAAGSFDETRFAQDLSATPGEGFDGRIGEVALWLTWLHDDEIAALALGVNPRKIRPLSLASYWPFFGEDSPEPDIHSTILDPHPLTITCTPTRADHPPVSHPFASDEAQWPLHLRPSGAFSQSGRFRVFP